MWKCSGRITEHICYDTVRDLAGKVERSTRKPWIRPTNEMISNMEV
jgi:hypothetical protein